jgi:hypothetical protein
MRAEVSDMGAAILLGGISFTVEKAAVAGVNVPKTFKRSVEPAYTVMSEIATILEQDPKRLRQGKPDDVRLRCVLNKLSYVELIMISVQQLEHVCLLRLETWAETETYDNDTHWDLMQKWAELSRTIMSLIEVRFAAGQVIQLSPKDIHQLHAPKKA